MFTRLNISNKLFGLIRAGTKAREARASTIFAFRMVANIPIVIQILSLNVFLIYCRHGPVVSVYLSLKSRKSQNVSS